MNVAIIVSSGISAGGGFQYEIKVASLVAQHFGADHPYTAKIFSPVMSVVEQYKKAGVAVTFVETGELERVLIEQHQTDLVYFLNPSNLCTKLVSLPYIVTVWDLCHRDFPEFPEVSSNFEFDRRENFFHGGALTKAIAVVVDSELGKQNMIERYGVDPSRVKVLKFLPRISSFDDTVLDVKAKYGIQNNYIFYPAQFWAHKNHIYIIKALQLLKSNYNLVIDVVFSGKDYGNLNYILEQAKLLGVAEQVHYIGFVDDSEIPSLYKNSMALVMPTYFGPTNIPPLEAFFYGVPVCYSDLPGLRDQVSGAAFLMDLTEPDCLAKILSELHATPEVADKLLVAAKQLLASWTDQDFVKAVSDIFAEFSIRRSCWGRQSYIRPTNTSFEEKFFMVSKFLRDNAQLSKIVIYGSGTVGDIIYALIPEKVVAFVDKKADYASEGFHSSGTYAPESLRHMDYDSVLISVLGREKEIKDYLVDQLGLAEQKIIHFN
jgi:glycosyltransferase involved in cell wall biosynthesis